MDLKWLELNLYKNMAYKIDRKNHKIDAKDRVLGRLATEISILLRGKQKPTFEPHVDNGDFVIVENSDKIKITGKKMEQKKYFNYSGYPGGLKTTKIKDISRGEALKKAIWSMLPKNKLRSEMIKRLTIK